MLITQAKGSPRTLKAGQGNEVDAAGDELGRVETNGSCFGIENINLAGADSAFTAPLLPRWVRAAGAGNLKVDAYDRSGTLQLGILIAILAGERQDIGCITKIYNTTNGTTATGITVYF